jgi:predicted XRE-type DNA-binding protein
MSRSMANGETIRRSGKEPGNVIADLGLSEAEDRLVKAALAYKISEIITKRHLNQVEGGSRGTARD